MDSEAATVRVKPTDRSILMVPRKCEASRVLFLLERRARAPKWGTGSLLTRVYRATYRPNLLLLLLLDTGQTHSCVRPIHPETTLTFPKYVCHPFFVHGIARFTDPPLVEYRHPAFFVFEPISLHSFAGVVL
jgi:hypothetical protein